MKINIKKTLILFKLSALSLFFQACGEDANSENSSTNRPTAIGKSTSINFSTRENSDVDKSDIKILGKRVGVIVQKHIETINNKEATLFSKHTNYCEVSGSTDIENYGEVQEHIKSISFNLCQDEEIIQNGDIEISYYNANKDGKFPKLISIIVQEPYFFNDLNLTRDTQIEVSNIIYKNSEIISFNTSITGQVIIDKNKVFNLCNFEQRVRL